jgi:deferrochelatase/peroxidase EfeB
MSVATSDGQHEKSNIEIREGTSNNKKEKRMADKIYVGKGWIKKFDNGGTVINVKLNLAELNKLTPNQYGDIALVVGERKQPDEKTKATHHVTVDTYVR